MSDAGEKIIQAASEALAFARCQKPIARLTINEHVYVPISEIERLRQGIADIKRATIEGRVCDDIAWYDTITTLHDFCDLLLNNGFADQQGTSPTEDK